jgi:hypothetical protein
MHKLHGNIVGPRNMRAQIQQVGENLRVALEAAGATLRFHFTGSPPHFGVVFSLRWHSGPADIKHHPIFGPAVSSEQGPPEVITPASQSSRPIGHVRAPSPALHP